MHSTATALLHPEIHVSAEQLVDHFASDYGKRREPLRNPHPENPVSEAIKNSAKDSSVLIAFIEISDELHLIVTERSANIRFGGQICFPGGHIDSTDANPEAAALREAQEEIGLPPERVTILGSMGEYFTQTGYRITPVIGLVDPTLSITHDLVPHEGEVAAIYTLPAHRLFSSSSYSLFSFGSIPSLRRGHYSLSHDDGNHSFRVAGPTVSIMIGLYEELLKSQGLLSVTDANEAAGA